MSPNKCEQNNSLPLVIDEAIAPVGFGPHCVAVQEHTFVAFLVGVCSSSCLIDNGVVHLRHSWDNCTRRCASWVTLGMFFRNQLECVIGGLLRMKTQAANVKTTNGTSVLTTTGAPSNSALSRVCGSMQT